MRSVEVLVSFSLACLEWSCQGDCIVFAHPSTLAAAMLAFEDLDTSGS